jgi:hypothetical protein
MSTEEAYAYNTTTSSVYVAPYPTANSTTVVKATGTGKPGYATSAVVFPGAASQASINFGLAAAGILGLMTTIF